MFCWIRMFLKTHIHSIKIRKLYFVLGAIMFTMTSQLSFCLRLITLCITLVKIFKFQSELSFYSYYWSISKKKKYFSSSRHKFFCKFSYALLGYLLHYFAFNARYFYFSHFYFFSEIFKTPRYFAVYSFYNKQKIQSHFAFHVGITYSSAWQAEITKQTGIQFKYYYLTSPSSLQ